MWSLRAAPRNYQLDAEKVKKLPGLKLSQNKAYGPYLQNRWFKYDRVNNIFFNEFFTSIGLKWATIIMRNFYNLSSVILTDCSRFGQQEIFKEIFKVVDSKSLNQTSKFSTFSRAKKADWYMALNTKACLV